MSVLLFQGISEARKRHLADVHAVLARLLLSKSVAASAKGDLSVHDSRAVTGGLRLLSQSFDWTKMENLEVFLASCTDDLSPVICALPEVLSPRHLHAPRVY
mgnify:CR=1 FL=1